MICGDPTVFIELRRQDLLSEAERERLAAQVPHAPSGVRRDLALVCLRLANWLDDPKQYLQQAPSGRMYWARIP